MFRIFTSAPTSRIWKKKKTMVRCVSLKRKIKVLNNKKTFLEFNNLEVGWAFITFGTCSNYTTFN
jgi:hypothetical protein